jgi:hypothetical protein
LGDAALSGNRVVFHYLDGKVDAEIYLTDHQSVERAKTLQAHCDEVVREDELFRLIQIHSSHAQN